MRNIAWMVVAMSGVVLLACGGGDHEELRTWMREETKDLRGRIPPLPQVKPYEPVAYLGSKHMEPFRPDRIVPEKRQGGDNQPDLARPKEPLEAYPLESLKYVGLLKKGRRTHAIIQADSALFQVHAGNYLGQDFGVVVAISETEIKLRELVQDASGDWAERLSSLKLQEKEIIQ